MYIPPLPSPPLDRSHRQDECPLSATGPPASEPPRRWPRGMLQLEQCLGSDPDKESPLVRNVDELGADVRAATLFRACLVPGIAPQTSANKDAAFEKTTNPKEPARVWSKTNTRDDARDYKRGEARGLFPWGVGPSVQISSARRPLLRILPESSLLLVFRFLYCFLLRPFSFPGRISFRLILISYFFFEFKNTTKFPSSSSHCCSLAP